MDPLPAVAATQQTPGGRSLRPWGWFEILGEGEGYLVKRLWLQRGRRLSLQRHRHRCEHWLVVRGAGTLLCGEEERQLRPGDTAVIPAGTLHRATAGHDGLELIEVQRGALLSEDDIERMEDDFGRVLSSPLTL